MLLHALECEPHPPLHVRCACKSHEQHKSYLAADLEGLPVELAESKEALREVQAQCALVTP